MARVFRVKGEARSTSRNEDLLVASTDGIYLIKDFSMRKLEEGEGEAVDILEEYAYAISGVVHYGKRTVEFGSRVMDLSISPEGSLLIAGKKNEIIAMIDGETRRFQTTNRVTGVDRIDNDTFVYSSRDGKCVVMSLEGEVIDRISVDRPFTSVVVGDKIYVGVSDGGIYGFTVGGEIEYVGEHVRRVFGLDYYDALFSVGEDRYVKVRKNGLRKKRKLHFDTYDVAAYEEKIAVVGPRYIRIARVEEL